MTYCDLGFHRADKLSYGWEKPILVCAGCGKTMR